MQKVTTITPSSIYASGNYYYYYYLIKKDYRRFKKRKYIQNHYKSSTTLIEKGHKGQVVTYDIYGRGLLGPIF